MIIVLWLVVVGYFMDSWLAPPLSMPRSPVGDNAAAAATINPEVALVSRFIDHLSLPIRDTSEAAFAQPLE